MNRKCPPSNTEYCYDAHQIRLQRLKIIDAVTSTPLAGIVLKTNVALDVRQGGGITKKNSHALRKYSLNSLHQGMTNFLVLS